MSTVMEKVAEVAPEVHEFLINTAPAIKTSPFHDEIIEEMNGIIKRAGMMSGLGKQLGVNVAGGIAMALAGDMYEATKRGLTKSRNYRNMLDNNPDLKKLPAKQVQESFNVLHQFNPEFASNPTVSGAFVRKNAQFPEFDTKQLTELVGSRKNIQDSRRLPQAGLRVPEFDSSENEMSQLQLKKMRREDAAHAGDNMKGRNLPPGQQGVSARQKVLLRDLANK
jgi:hypothetical protein